MPKYRKRPLEVDAVQWDGSNHFRVAGWLQAHEIGGILAVSGDHLEIGVGPSVFDLEPGEWLIRGIEGELYPCSESVFEATYDLVE